jgi:hypothetical protein
MSFSEIRGFISPASEHQSEDVIFGGNNHLRELQQPPSHVGYDINDEDMSSEGDVSSDAASEVNSEPGQDVSESVNGTSDDESTQGQSDFSEAEAAPFVKWL